jgi:hypothetical protein
MKHSKMAMAVYGKKMNHGGEVMSEKESMIDEIMRRIDGEHFDKSKESDLDYEMDGLHEPFHDADDVEAIDEATELKKMIEEIVKKRR